MYTSQVKQIKIRPESGMLCELEKVELQANNARHGARDIIAAQAMVTWYCSATPHCGIGTDESFDKVNTFTLLTRQPSHARLVHIAGKG